MTIQCFNNFNHPEREAAFQRKEARRETALLAELSLLLDAPEDAIRLVADFDPGAAFTFQFVSCRLYRVGRESLVWNAREIAQLCSGPSLLFRLLEGHLLQSPDALQFNLLVSQTVASGIPREDYPGPALSSSEVVKFSDRIQGTPDQELARIWERLCPAVVDANPGLAGFPFRNAPVETIRHWIHAPENQAALRMVRRLDLSGLRLTGVPMEIRLCTGLQRLDLSWNQITSLGRGAFLGCRALEHLDLFGNQLTTLKTHCFQGLGRLCILHLSRNRLTSLGERAFHGLSSLRSLFLSENKMTSLDLAAFDGLDALKEIHFIYNRLPSFKTQAFVEMARRKGIALQLPPVTLRQILGYAGNHPLSSTRRSIS